MATINAKRAASAGIRWASISLAPVTYTIGGALIGLAGTGLVRLAYSVRSIEGSRNHVV
jgi:hypothetical protein